MATDALAYITELLKDYGLTNLAGWAADQIAHGVGKDELVQRMRTTPEFQQRFPAIAEREKKGLPPISPGEYVAYERQAASLMRSYGLPPGFHDQPEDFTRLIANDVSADELNKRIQAGYDRVMTLPSEVRATFRDYYGPSGDSALAAYFLNPDRATPLLMQQANAAAIGGTGKRFGFDLTVGIAERLGSTGITDNAAAQQFGQLNSQKALYDANVHEQNNLSIGVEGVNATFGLDATSAEQVKARQDTRAAQFAGSDNFQTSQQGVKGLGTANRR